MRPKTVGLDPLRFGSLRFGSLGARCLGFDSLVLGGLVLPRLERGSLKFGCYGFVHWLPVWLLALLSHHLLHAVPAIAATYLFCARRRPPLFRQPERVSLLGGTSDSFPAVNRLLVEEETKQLTTIPLAGFRGMTNRTDPFYAFPRHGARFDAQNDTPGPH